MSPIPQRWAHGPSLEQSAAESKLRAAKAPRAIADEMDPVVIGVVVRLDEAVSLANVVVQTLAQDAALQAIEGAGSDALDVVDLLRHAPDATRHSRIDLRNVRVGIGVAPRSVEEHGDVHTPRPVRICKRVAAFPSRNEKLKRHGDRVRRQGWQQCVTAASPLTKAAEHLVHDTAGACLPPGTSEAEILRRCTAARGTVYGMTRLQAMHQIPASVPGDPMALIHEAVDALREGWWAGRAEGGRRGLGVRG